MAVLDWFTITRTRTTRCIYLPVGPQRKNYAAPHLCIWRPPRAAEGAAALSTYSHPSVATSAPLYTTTSPFGFFYGVPPTLSLQALLKEAGLNEVRRPGAGRRGQGGQAGGAAKGCMPCRHAFFLLPLQCGLQRSAHAGWQAPDAAWMTPAGCCWVEKPLPRPYLGRCWWAVTEAHQHAQRANRVLCLPNAVLTSPPPKPTTRPASPLPPGLLRRPVVVRTSQHGHRAPAVRGL